MCVCCCCRFVVVVVWEVGFVYFGWVLQFCLLLFVVVVVCLFVLLLLFGVCVFVFVCVVVVECTSLYLCCIPFTDGGKYSGHSSGFFTLIVICDAVIG